MRKWLTRAIETRKFHIKQRKENNSWRLTDTSKKFKRSLGAICEDIIIAEAYRDSPSQVEKFKHINELLAWIRERKLNNELSEVDD